MNIVLKNVLWNKHYFYPHVVQEETKGQGVSMKQLAQGATVSGRARLWREAGGF